MLFVPFTYLTLPFLGCFSYERVCVCAAGTLIDCTLIAVAYTNTHHMNLNEMFYQSTVKLFDCNLIKNLLNVNFIYGRFVQLR